MTPHRLHDVRRWSANALRKGAVQRSLSTVEWDISGKCEMPVFVQLDGQQRTVRRDSTSQRAGGYSRLIIYTRCRKCAACLRYRSMLWMHRAETEIRSAQRTWFVTYTLSPEQHSLMWMRACQRLRKAGINPFELSAERGFKERAAETQKLFTDYMKRLRKQGKSQIRYLLVVESHKSGLPHLHALLHEVSGSLTYRDVSGQWYAGFTAAKLVEGTSDKSVRYVTKYLAKQAVSRVRASQKYGDASVIQQPSPLLSIGGDQGTVSAVKTSPLSKEWGQKPPLF